MKTIFKTSKKMIFALILLMSQLTWVSCVFEQDPPNEFYYTFTGESVGSFLTKNDQYSEFVGILKKAKLYDLLTTYGEYTCFAPTNTAIDSFLLSRNLTSIEQLDFATCDTLSRTHLLKGLYYTTDLEDGALPATNFMDRYLMYSSDTVVRNGVVDFGFFINKSSELVSVNDSVENGVVHTLDKVVTPSNMFLPQLMQADTTISIFMEALMMTGFDQKMQLYIDETYRIGYDSIDLKLFSGDDWNRPYGYPSRRLFGFTGFVEKNDVYRQHGIHSANDLINKLKAKTPPFDLVGNVTYNDTYTDTTNMLYRYISYHFFERLGNYTDWNVKPDIRLAQARHEYLDPEDFYETLCPFTMMKFQTDRDGKLYINRRRVNEGALAEINPEDVYAAAVPGAYVYQASESGTREQGALNGVYHYVNGIVAYNSTTVNDVLNTRMRLDATTLSPDFMTSGARGRTKADGTTNRLIRTAFKNDYVKNFIFHNKQVFTSIRSDPYYGSFQCDAVDVQGLFDFSIKLPPLPPGQYEVRLGTNIGGRKSALQVYFDGAACGIPIDLDQYRGQPAIGYTNDTGDEDVDNRVDKDMKLRGFMKGPDSWFTGNDHITAQRDPGSLLAIRIIVTSQNFELGQEHYIRFKNVRKDNPNGYFPLDYIEFCPKSVYGSPERAEDRH